MTRDLVISRLSLARRTLAEAKSVQEIKQVADIAEAARIYAQRSRLGLEVINDCAALRVYAEHRLGVMLKETPDAKRGPKELGSEPEPNSIPTLAELGLDKKLSFRSQAIAELSLGFIEEHIEKTLSKALELSVGQLLELALEQRRAAARAKFNQELLLAGMAKSGVAMEGPFALVLADPPWRYEGVTTTPDRTIEQHYPTCTVEEICSHVPQTTEDAMLFLWATAPLLREALKVMDAWGFSYKTNAVWDKQKIGMGYWFRIQHEHLLVGVKGKVRVPPEAVRVSSVFREARTKHSRKPLLVYEWLETAFPGLPKLEMYARTKRHGWTGWGNEV